MATLIFLLYKQGLYILNIMLKSFVKDHSQDLFVIFLLYQVDKIIK